MSKVLAVLCSDIHLCHECPSARAAEPNWYEAMARTLADLRAVAERANVPVVCAGDVFHSWDAPPELINFAIRQLPVMFAIPGQHDLPFHELNNIHKSPFQTLVESGVLKYLTPGCGHLLSPNLRVYPFPWSVPLTNCLSKGPEIKLAVCHSYVWTSGTGYVGASPESLVFNIRTNKGYDVMLFGDNHVPFHTMRGRTMIVNPGCLIRRRKNERLYPPTVYLLHEDASVAPVRLSTVDDKWVEEVDEKIEVLVEGVDQFLEELRTLDADSLDFEAAVHRYCEQQSVGEQTKALILNSLEAVRGKEGRS